MAANQSTAGEEPAYFGPGLFHFLRDLELNNDRGWFQVNKDRYEAQVKDPMLRFIAAFGEHLHAISPHIVADPRPVGGSMFRIYRDTRFSQDKRPYKTNVGAHFRHSVGKDAHAPGFYVHLEPGGCMAGGGLWHPDPAALQQIRDRIAGHPDAWQAVLATGIVVEGESLKRAPSGYDAQHPFVDDLKRKDFYAMTHLSEAQICHPRFLEQFAEICRATVPLMAFLTDAVGLPW